MNVPSEKLLALIAKWETEKAVHSARTHLEEYAKGAAEKCDAVIKDLQGVINESAS